MNVDLLLNYFLDLNLKAGAEIPANRLAIDPWGKKRSTLLPWQRDVLKLVGDARDQMEDAPATGPWAWAKVVILDHQVDAGLKTVQALITRLMNNGEEFVVDTFRPSALPDTPSLAAFAGVPSPRPYRFVLVTWGRNLGMTREEIASDLIGAFGDGTWNSNPGKAAADGSRSPA